MMIQICQGFSGIYCLTGPTNFLLVIYASKQEKPRKSGKCLTPSLSFSLHFGSLSLSPSGPDCAVAEAGLFKAMALPFGLGVHMCTGGPHFDSKWP